MRRRELTLMIVGGAAIASSITRLAYGAAPVIGFLGSASASQWSERLSAFHAGLGETGFAVGRNVAIEYRWAEGEYSRLPALAAELVRLPATVIAVIGNTASTFAARAATKTIPIIFRIAVDPVEAGLVTSLSRPDGNITGITTMGVEAAPKQLEVLHETVPRASPLALLLNPSNRVLSGMLSKEVSAAAAALGRQLHIVHASIDADFRPAFVRMNEMRIGGVVIGADTFFNSRNEALAALAVAHRLPAISPYREFAIAGGLFSYGGSIADASRQAGNYVGQILRGKKVSELPVQRVAKVEFFANLKTARALGVALPAWLLSRADEVIE